jgi:subtilase family serine protease
LRSHISAFYESEISAMCTSFKAAFCTFLAAGFLFSASAFGQVSAVAASRPQSRIVAAIDSSRLKVLQDNTHPFAKAEFDRGPVDSHFAMNHLVLALQRSAEQEADLELLITQQSDPSSSNFHHWLTPQQFGQMYGPADADIAKITNWLQSQGFTVENVANGRGTIEFSGTAGQVTSAFHTEIHNYVVEGVQHYANVSDPQIPEALSPVVAGVGALHNFLPQPQVVQGQRVKRNSKTGQVSPATESAERPLPEFVRTTLAGNTKEDITPYDFATIYNVLPLWNAGINGAGQTIAIAGQSDINLADVATFQSSFGLANNPPTIIHNGTDPGYNSSQLENSLDVEWSGAVAPGASITLVVSSTAYNSASYIINNHTATIMSESYGACELSLGSTSNAMYNNLWQQGAAEGISIFGAAGDQGSAGCENSSIRTENPATTGLQVNGLTSSPYITAVGGTDFFWEEGSPSTYWNATAAANGSTALGYIPEIAWNATCTSNYIIFVQGSTGAEADCNTLAKSSTQSGLVFINGGSGGMSACTTPNGTKPANCSGGYAKPSWQTGTGVPNDSKRDVPDISFFASAGYQGYPGSAYLVCVSATEPCTYSDSTDVTYQEIGGTSVSSPAMAGIMALVQQKLGQSQGLANPMLYKMAAAESLSGCNASNVGSGNSCVFYDTTLGTNSMPCSASSPNCTVSTSGDSIGVLNGYSAGIGYDQATGLGSINVTNFVNAWASVPGSGLNLVIPNHTYGDAPFTIAATSNSPATITYAVISGPATLSGTKLTITGVGTVKVQALQPATASYLAGGVTAAFTVAQGTPVVTWNPTVTQTRQGNSVGSGVLDATANQGGSFLYYAALGSQANTQINAATVLSPGVYTLTASFHPTSANYSVVTATITFTVTSPQLWFGNPSGSISLFSGGSAITGFALNGGGVVAAIDNAGNIWSINASGNSVAEINKNGAMVNAGYTGGGISSAAALAIDGNGVVWVVNGGNSLSAFSNNGTAISPSTGYTGGNISAPDGVAVDLSGRVWITNAGNNTVTEFLGVAAPTASLTTAVTNSTLGVKP